MKTLLRVLSVAILLSGCAPPIQRVSDSATPVVAKGFSVLPPKGDYWFQMGGSDTYRVVFGKTTPDELKQKKTLILTAEILHATKKHDISTPEGLKAEVDTYLTLKVPRHTLKSFKSDHYRDERLRTDCVRSEAINEERDNPNYPGIVFLITGSIVTCRHPFSPDTVVVVGYSDRRPVDTTSILDEVVRKEVEWSVNSLELFPVR
jgi:hypothetical protein